MSHQPPVPDQAVAPFPLDAQQSAARRQDRHDLAKREASNLDAGETGAGETGDGKTVRIAVGAAIGSAAIAAALLYYKRPR